MENVFMCFVGFATIGVMFAVIQGIEAIVRNCVITTIKNAAYKALSVSDDGVAGLFKSADFRKFGMMWNVRYYYGNDTIKITNISHSFMDVRICDTDD